MKLDNQKVIDKPNDEHRQPKEQKLDDISVVERKRRYTVKQMRIHFLVLFLKIVEI